MVYLYQRLRKNSGHCHLDDGFLLNELCKLSLSITKQVERMVGYKPGGCRSPLSVICVGILTLIRKKSENFET